jgi:hypothetical protein
MLVAQAQAETLNRSLRVWDGRGHLVRVGAFGSGGIDCGGGVIVSFAGLHRPIAIAHGRIDRGIESRKRSCRRGPSIDVVSRN